MRTVQTQNFVKILRAFFEIWTKNIKNALKRGVFPHLWPPMIFFKNRALSLLYPYGALTSCKKLEKTNERSLRYLKTDTRTHRRTDGRKDGQGQLLRTHSSKPGVQNISITNFYFWARCYSLFYVCSQKIKNCVIFTEKMCNAGRKTIWVCLMLSIKSIFWPYIRKTRMS